MAWPVSMALFTDFLAPDPTADGSNGGQDNSAPFAIRGMLSELWPSSSEHNAGTFALAGRQVGALLTEWLTMAPAELDEPVKPLKEEPDKFLTIGDSAVALRSRP